MTERERAIFEGAISLSAIRHQFGGIPVTSDPDLLRALEKAIGETMKVQPYKTDVKARIDVAGMKGGSRDPYDYETLKGRHLDVTVVTQYGKAKATSRMRYIPELDFTLMFVEKVEELDE
jgi:hypothetical protein